MADGRSGGYFDQIDLSSFGGTAATTASSSGGLPPAALMTTSATSAAPGTTDAPLASRPLPPMSASVPPPLPSTPLLAGLPPLLQQQQQHPLQLHSSSVGGNVQPYQPAQSAPPPPLLQQPIALSVPSSTVSSTLPLPLPLPPLPSLPGLPGLPLTPGAVGQLPLPPLEGGINLDMSSMPLPPLPSLPSLPVSTLPPLLPSSLPPLQLTSEPQQQQLQKRQQSSLPGISLDLSTLPPPPPLPSSLPPLVGGLPQLNLGSLPPLTNLPPVTDLNFDVNTTSLPPLPQSLPALPPLTPLPPLQPQSQPILQQQQQQQQLQQQQLQQFADPNLSSAQGMIRQPMLEDYILDTCSTEFERIAKEKLAYIMQPRGNASSSANVNSAGGGREVDLPTVLGVGVDPAFDELLRSIGVVARSRPKPTIDMILQWRRSERDDFRMSLEAAAAAAVTMSSSTSGSFGGTDHNNNMSNEYNNNTPTSATFSSSVLNSRDALIQRDRHDQATAYITCRALIAVVEELEESHLEGALGDRLEEMVFMQLKNANLQHIQRSMNRKHILELFARLIGAISGIRFASMSDRFVAELEKVPSALNPSQQTGSAANNANNAQSGNSSALNESATALIVRSIRFLKLRIYPLDALEEASQFLLSCARFFVGTDDSSVLISTYSEVFTELLLQFAQVSSAELNLPAWGRTIDLLHAKVDRIYLKPRYFNVAYPLYTAVLCVMRPDMFVRHWGPFLDTCLVRLKEKGSRAVLMACMIRMYWVFLFKAASCGPSSSNEQLAVRRVEMLLRTLFPAARRHLFPSDIAPSYSVYALLCVCLWDIDFGFKYLNAQLLPAAAETPLTAHTPLDHLWPERTIVGLQTYLLVLRHLAQGQTRPTFPGTDDLLGSRVGMFALPQTAPIPRDTSFRLPAITQSIEHVGDVLMKLLNVLDNGLGSMTMLDERFLLNRAQAIVSTMNPSTGSGHGGHGASSSISSSHVSSGSIGSTSANTIVGSTISSSSGSSTSGSSASGGGSGSGTVSGVTTVSASAAQSNPQKDAADPQRIQTHANLVSMHVTYPRDRQPYFELFAAVLSAAPELLPFAKTLRARRIVDIACRCLLSVDTTLAQAARDALLQITDICGATMVVGGLVRLIRAIDDRFAELLIASLFPNVPVAGSSAERLLPPGTVFAATLPGLLAAVWAAHSTQLQTEFDRLKAQETAHSVSTSASSTAVVGAGHIAVAQNRLNKSTSSSALDATGGGSLLDQSWLLAYEHESLCLMLLCSPSAVVRRHAVGLMALSTDICKILHRMTTELHRQPPGPATASRAIQPPYLFETYDGAYVSRSGPEDGVASPIFTQPSSTTLSVPQGCVPALELACSSDPSDQMLWREHMGSIIQRAFPNSTRCVRKCREAIADRIALLQPIIAHISDTPSRLPPVSNVFGRQFNRMTTALNSDIIDAWRSYMSYMVATLNGDSEASRAAVIAAANASSNATMTGGVAARRKFAGSSSMATIGAAAASSLGSGSSTAVGGGGSPSEVIGGTLAGNLADAVRTCAVLFTCENPYLRQSAVVALAQTNWSCLLQLLGEISGLVRAVFAETSLQSTSTASSTSSPSGTIGTAAIGIGSFGGIGIGASGSGAGAGAGGSSGFGFGLGGLGLGFGGSALAAVPGPSNPISALGFTTGKRSIRKLDRLRASLTQLFRIMARTLFDPRLMSKSLNSPSGVVVDDTGDRMVQPFIAFIMETKTFLRNSLVNVDWEHQHLRVQFCGLVASIVRYLEAKSAMVTSSTGLLASNASSTTLVMDTLSAKSSKSQKQQQQQQKQQQHQSQSGLTLSFELRSTLFRLCEQWCGLGKMSEKTREVQAHMILTAQQAYRDTPESGPLNSLLIDDLRDLEEAALKTMIAICRGPVIALIDPSSQLQQPHGQSAPTSAPSGGGGRRGTAPSKLSSIAPTPAAASSSTKQRLSIVQFDLESLFAWLDAIFTSPDRRISALGHCALENLLRFNRDQPIILNTIIQRCYASSETSAGAKCVTGYFTALVDVLSQDVLYPFSTRRLIILALLKAGDISRDIRLAALRLVTVIERRCFPAHKRLLSGSIAATAHDASLSSNVSALYKSGQLRLSLLLAHNLPELTADILTEAARRIETLPNQSLQRELLAVIEPWVLNIRLTFVDSLQHHQLQLRPVSPASIGILVDMIHFVARVGDRHPVQVESLWASLVSPLSTAVFSESLASGTVSANVGTGTAGPTQEALMARASQNMRVVVQFLADVVIARGSPAFLGYAKRVCVFLSRTPLAGTLLQLLIERLQQPELMVPVDAVTDLTTEPKRSRARNISMGGNIVPTGASSNALGSKLGIAGGGAATSGPSTSATASAAALASGVLPAPTLDDLAAPQPPSSTDYLPMVPSQFALAMLSELAIEAAPLLQPFLALLAHTACISIDSPNSLVAREARATLVNLLRHAQEQRMIIMAATGANATLCAESEQQYSRLVSLINDNTVSSNTSSTDPSGALMPRSSALPDSVLSPIVTSAVMLLVPHDNDTDLIQLRRHWGEIALGWGTLCPVIDLAASSFRILRFLAPPVTLQMLTEMVDRMSNTIADSNPHINDFSVQIARTLTARLPVLDGQNADQLLPSIFWVSMAIMLSADAILYERGLAALEMIFNGFHIDDPAFRRELMARRPPSAVAAPMMYDDSQHQMHQPQSPEGLAASFDGLIPLLFRGLAFSSLRARCLELINTAAKFEDPNALICSSPAWITLVIFANLPGLMDVVRDCSTIVAQSTAAQNAQQPHQQQQQQQQQSQSTPVPIQYPAKHQWAFDLMSFIATKAQDATTSGAPSSSSALHRLCTMFSGCKFRNDEDLIKQCVYVAREQSSQLMDLTAPTHVLCILLAHLASDQSGSAFHRNAGKALRVFATTWTSGSPIAISATSSALLMRPALDLLTMDDSLGASGADGASNTANSGGGGAAATLISGASSAGGSTSGTNAPGQAVKLLADLFRMVVVVPPTHTAWVREYELDQVITRNRIRSLLLAVINANIEQLQSDAAAIAAATGGLDSPTAGLMSSRPDSRMFGSQSMLNLPPSVLDTQQQQQQQLQHSSPHLQQLGKQYEQNIQVQVARSTHFRDTSRSIAFNRPSVAPPIIPPIQPPQPVNYHRRGISSVSTSFQQQPPFMLPSIPSTANALNVDTGAQTLQHRQQHSNVQPFSASTADTSFSSNILFSGAVPVTTTLSNQQQQQQYHHHHHHRQQQPSTSSSISTSVTNSTTMSSSVPQTPSAVATFSSRSAVTRPSLPLHSEYSSPMIGTGASAGYVESTRSSSEFYTPFDYQPQAQHQSVGVVTASSSMQSLPMDPEYDDIIAQLDEVGAYFEQLQHDDD